MTSSQERYQVVSGGMGSYVKLPICPECGALTAEGSLRPHIDWHIEQRGEGV